MHEALRRPLVWLALLMVGSGVAAGAEPGQGKSAVPTTVVAEQKGPADEELELEFPPKSDAPVAPTRKIYRSLEQALESTERVYVLRLDNAPGTGRAIFGIVEPDDRVAALPPAIGRLTDLEVLDLSGNDLTALPEEICRLTGLRELYLKDNRFSSFPPQILRLRNLEVLLLSGNRIPAVPVTIRNLTKLRLLGLGTEFWWGDYGANKQLCGNPISRFPDVFDQCRELRWLNLAGTRLAELPPGISKLKHLQLLDLSQNRRVAGQIEGLREEMPGTKITSHFTAYKWIEERMGESGQFRRFTLGEVPFNLELDPEIAQFANLRELDAAGCGLARLPPEIGTLRHLEKLKLQDNDITQLPPEIGQLRELRHLDLSNNKLTRLPPEIGHLRKLEALVLSGNTLTAPQNTIQELLPNARITW